uniref:Uncharacterized protein n=1 Tax=Mimivirus LCMiAC02 TaxID=2506609 RepID=A0A481Z173_9VIRU|nr:MAG: hypothetical protein LCMiAC02_05470 [Mimivirus LCMiAC02]
MNYYKRKYFKYKKKYIKLRKQLQKQQFGGARELKDLLVKYKDLDKNITIQNIKICIDKKLDTKDIRLKSGQISMTRNMFQYFMDKYSLNGDKFDLYYSIPLKIFVGNYIQQKIEKSDGYFLRGPKFPFKYENATEFLNDIKPLMQETNKKSSDYFHIDKNKNYRPHLISTNIALFGNDYYSEMGESTYDYFLQSATQITSSLKYILSDFLFINYPIIKYKYIHILVDKIKELEKKIKTGVLVQALLPKNTIDEYAYLCYEYGKPLFLNNNYTKKYFEMPVEKRLQFVINKTNDLNLSKLSFYKNVFFKENDEKCKKHNNIQARIVISKKLVQDQDIKINYFIEEPRVLNSINSIINTMVLDKDKSFDELYINLKKEIREDNKVFMNMIEDYMLYGNKSTILQYRKHIDWEKYKNDYKKYYIAKYKILEKIDLLPNFEILGLKGYDKNSVFVILVENKDKRSTLNLLYPD